MKRRRIILGGAGAAALVLAGLFAWPHLAMPDYHVGTHMESGSGAVTVPWTNFGGDDGATQYSSVDQITPANVAGLKVAWVYRTGEPPAQGSYQNTPIIAAGSLVTCDTHQKLSALDPATGMLRWRYDPHITQEQTGAAKWMCRGIAQWHDPMVPAGGACADRLLLATLDRRLIALDARTGKTCAGFGAAGIVTVEPEKKLLFDSELQFDSPPAVVNGVVVIGSRVADGARLDAPKGTVRAFDARTGAVRWTFDAIPASPADPTWASWHQGIDSKAPIRVGGTNVWADMSVDQARDLVFVPTSDPAIDSWGGGRPGNNDLATAVIAIQGSTGRVVWHHQIVHHDVFDMDLPSAPLLTDLRVNGRVVPAAVQLTKMGTIFAFDRVTGKPLFPIVERPVPQTSLPGEWTSPTQPFPATMPSLMPTTGMRPQDAWGLTPIDRGACRRTIEALGSTAMFSPPSLKGATVYPGYMGGTNMGHRAYDPKRRLLIANVTRIPMMLKMKPRGDTPLKPGDDGPAAPFVIEKQDYLLSPLGLPCNAPPWGQLAAIDLETQKIVWQVPLGTVEKLGPVPVPLKLGTPSRGGPIATGGGVVFIAGTMDDRIRAFETASGRELWSERLPAGGQATPMTYMANGRQYVVIAAGGHSWMKTTPGDYLIAFALKR